MKRKMKYRTLPVVILLTFIPSVYLASQQVPDTVYRHAIHHPAYGIGEGPVVLIDQAHNNFHTMGGGFAPFARLLEQDGYKVRPLETEITRKALPGDCRILVIANPVHQSNVERWILPTPSAFSPGEIGAISSWVRKGGRLLLIADHMPFAGAAEALAEAFGFGFINGFAFTGEQSWPPSRFTRADNTLPDSPIAGWAGQEGALDSIVTFTGSAFIKPREAKAVLNFRPEHWSLIPDTAWRFSTGTKRVNLAGHCQGAILEYGAGRIAVFGEAAMFTAQMVNGQMAVGFNSPDAPCNAPFVLNVIHWLDNKDHPEKDSSE